MVMEAFSRMMSTMVERSLLSGFSVGSRNQEELIVSYLLFVDETLYFVSLVLNNSEI
jgi:hypothetical protein